MPKNSSTTKNIQSISFKIVLELLREFELAYNLAPKLTKAQIQQLKLLLNQIVKDK